MLVPALHLPVGDLLQATGNFDDGTGWSGSGFNLANGINDVNVETAGNRWDVNLSGDMKIAQGWDYTVTFDAKGADGRTLVAGIGDTAEPYANSTGTVMLSDTWQTFTLHVDSYGLVGGDDRVLFDMGAEVGEVDIDNVSVVVGHVGTEFFNYPSGNLLPNGTFEVTEGVAVGWGGNALNPVGGVSQANVETAGNAWDVNLSGYLGLNAGWDYTVTFDAGASRVGPCWLVLATTTRLGRDSLETVTVGSDWQTHALHLSADALGGGDGRVMFEMGADTGLLEIDNVSVVAGYVGTAGVVAVPTPDSAAPALTIDGNDVVVSPTLRRRAWT